MSASAPIYTGGWFGVPAPSADQEVSIYTAGWFLFSFGYPRAELGDPQAEAVVEQKIPGQLTRFHTVGTGTHLSPGTMGGSHDQVVL